MENEFEIIDRSCTRRRYKRADGYSWQWALKAGTMDVDDHDLVEVLRAVDDEIEVVASFPHPVMVGNVSERSCLMMPMRELQVEQCPQCGWVK